MTNSYPNNQPPPPPSYNPNTNHYSNYQSSGRSITNSDNYTQPALWVQQNSSYSNQQNQYTNHINDRNHHQIHNNITSNSSNFGSTLGWIAVNQPGEENRNHSSYSNRNSIASVNNSMPYNSNVPPPPASLPVQGWISTTAALPPPPPPPPTNRLPLPPPPPPPLPKEPNLPAWMASNDKSNSNAYGNGNGYGNTYSNRSTKDLQNTNTRGSLVMTDSSLRKVSNLPSWMTANSAAIPSSSSTLVGNLKEDSPGMSSSDPRGNDRAIMRKRKIGVAPSANVTIVPPPPPPKQRKMSEEENVIDLTEDISPVKKPPSVSTMPKSRSDKKKQKQKRKQLRKKCQKKKTVFKCCFCNTGPFSWAVLEEHMKKEHSKPLKWNMRKEYLMEDPSSEQKMTTQEKMIKQTKVGRVREDESKTAINGCWNVGDQHVISITDNKTTDYTDNETTIDSETQNPKNSADGCNSHFEKSHEALIAQKRLDLPFNEKDNKVVDEGSIEAHASSLKPNLVRENKDGATISAAASININNDEKTFFSSSCVSDKAAVTRRFRSKKRGAKARYNCHLCNDAKLLTRKLFEKHLNISHNITEVDQRLRDMCRVADTPIMYKCYKCNSQPFKWSGLVSHLRDVHNLVDPNKNQQLLKPMCRIPNNNSNVSNNKTEQKELNLIEANYHIPNAPTGKKSSGSSLEIANSPTGVGASSGKAYRDNPLETVHSSKAEQKEINPIEANYHIPNAPTGKISSGSSLEIVNSSTCVDASSGKIYGDNPLETVHPSTESRDFQSHCNTPAYADSLEKQKFSKELNLPSPIPDITAYKMKSLRISNIQSSGPASLVESRYLSTSDISFGPSKGFRRSESQPIYKNTAIDRRKLKTGPQSFDKFKNDNETKDKQMILQQKSADLVKNIAVMKAKLAAKVKKRKLENDSSSSFPLASDNHQQVTGTPNPIDEMKFLKDDESQDAAEDELKLKELEEEELSKQKKKVDESKRVLDNISNKLRTEEITGAELEKQIRDLEMKRNEVESLLFNATKKLVNSRKKNDEAKAVSLASRKKAADFF